MLSCYQAKDAAASGCTHKFKKDSGCPFNIKVCNTIHIYSWHFYHFLVKLLRLNLCVLRIIERKSCWIQVPLWWNCKKIFHLNDLVQNESFMIRLLNDSFIYYSTLQLTTANAPSDLRLVNIFQSLNWFWKVGFCEEFKHNTTNTLLIYLGDWN